MTTSLEYTKSSGNVYKDLGFEDAEERLVKTKLAMCVNELVTKKKLKQKSAAKILRIDADKFSDLMNGRLTGFSMEQLSKYLILLDQDIEIVLKHCKKPDD